MTGEPSAEAVALASAAFHAANLLLADASRALSGNVDADAVERVRVVSDWGKLGSREADLRAALHVVAALHHAREYERERGRTATDDDVRALIRVQLLEAGERARAKRITLDVASKLRAGFYAATKQGRPAGGGNPFASAPGARWDDFATTLTKALGLRPLKGETVRKAWTAARKVGNW